MRIILLLTGIFLLVSCTNNTTTTNKTVNKKVSIPFLFGFNNDYFPSDSTSVQVFGPNDSLVFENVGYKPFWGFQPGGIIPLTGDYKVRVTYFTDSLTRRNYQDVFSIDGTETQIDLAINIMNMPSQEVHLTKYFDNKFNVKLDRLWDPQKQFSSNKELLPDYQWTNKFDSTIFGIYRQFSSSMNISWVRNWNIAYMKFQKHTDSGWIYLPCNAPRLWAELKKDSSGKTLTDMVLSCPAKEFQKNNRYRILIEYGINDAIIRRSKGGTATDSSFYYEPHIYQVTDTFSLK